MLMVLALTVVLFVFVVAVSQWLNERDRRKG